jgi:RHS repeat-associated protein
MTKYQFTGQFSYASDFGLLYYNARWYDPALSRFTQADSIVPGGVQGYDRYAYVNNNPVKYTDPSGHMTVEENGGRSGCSNRYYCAGSLPREKNNPYVGLPRPHASTASLNCLCNHRPPTPPSQGTASPIGTYIQILSLTIGYIKTVAAASPQMYLKAFTWAKAFDPNPVLDGALGIVGQGVDDAINYPDLSTAQRIERMGVAGGESVLTGIASEGIAAVVGLATVNPIVFGAVQVGSSVAIDTWLWPAYNHKYFGAAGY